MSRSSSRARRARAQDRPAKRAADASGHPILDLQRSAGNQAVAQLARDTKGPAPKEERTGTRITVEIEELGTIEALSFQLGEPGPPPSAERSQEKITKATIVAKTGEHSPKIYQHASDGKPFPKVVVTMETRNGRITYTMTNVYFNVVSGSGGSDPTESYALVFDSFAFEHDKDDTPEPGLPSG